MEAAFVGYRIDVTGTAPKRGQPASYRLPIEPDFHDLVLPELVFQYNYREDWLGCNCIDYVLKRHCMYRISFLFCEVGNHFWWPCSFVKRMNDGERMNCGSSIWDWIIDQGSLDISPKDMEFDRIKEDLFYKEICRIYSAYEIEVKWGIYRVEC